MTTQDLAAFVDRLATLDRDVSDAERIDQIRLMERLNAVTAAKRAEVTVDFADSQETEQRAAGLPDRQVGRGIVAQVALARRESPARTSRYLGCARLLVSELPQTLAALQAGDTSEWRALIVAREAVCLTERDHRESLDAELGPRLHELGDRQVEAEARRIAYRLDPQAFVDRSRSAAKDRRVWLRPAPDTMARLTALVPVSQGVAAFAALIQAADAGRAVGDERGRGQIMADTMVERITGQAIAEDVVVQVNLLMTDQSLLGDPGGDGTDEPGFVDGYGPVPAGVARDLARGTKRSRTWVRRLFRRPDTGQLAAIDAKRRCFDGPIRDAIIARDQFCRTPYCGAPIRHADHPEPAARGGPTTLENGAGLCEACNYAKIAPGWRARPGPDGAGDEVIITTPTGHTYTSRPPDLPSGVAQTGSATAS